MKSRDNLLRLKHFQVEDKTRQLTQIDMMIAEFEKMFGDLSAQVQIEEEKAGITDPTHFAYPTFAKAARQRQENLDGSIRDLKDKRVNAEAALAEADEELKKAQRLEQRDGGTGVL
ncbi:MAG: flagellar export protein FliJ, partial [Pseudomonadota bacterium]